MVADRGHRPRLQRMFSRRPVGDAIAYGWLLIVTLRTAKRLQRIVACHIRNVLGCLRRSQSIGLRERRKVLREQGWQCSAGDSKWADNL